MADKFTTDLKSLINCSIHVFDNKSYPEEGTASVVIIFTNGTKLRTDYWRLIKGGERVLSSFDHQQKYGLPAPINAKIELQNELENKVVSDAKLDTNTGDLVFYFENRLTLQALNFTGYEIWEITFPDGTKEYSNYNKQNSQVNIFVLISRKLTTANEDTSRPDQRLTHARSGPYTHR
jgi:hypothetical protein